MRIDGEFDIRSFQRGLDSIRQKRLARAANIALGRVATTVRKVASQEIRQNLTIKASVARDAIKIRKDRANLAVVIEASGRPIPLKEYEARGGARGVTFRVSRKQPRKVYRNKLGKAFIVQGIDGNVFIRVGARTKGRGAPIRKVYGPSVPQYFVTRIVRNAMKKTYTERWPIEFGRAFRGISASA